MADGGRGNVDDPGTVSPLRLSSLTSLALLAFASNSILCRGALGAGAIDPAPFTWIRLVSGAATLALLLHLRSRAGGTAPEAGREPRAGRGAPLSAGTLALALYALAFSWAYLRIPAGVGALVLFAATQATMIGWALRRGDRPGSLELVGIAIALLGLLGLAAPGRTAPDPLGVALMALAGMAWGVYTLLGKQALDPVATNAAAFAGSALLATLVLILPTVGRGFTGRGVLLATASGALASAVGYSLWYAALPHLSRVRAAALQLTVPVLAAVAAVALLDERATLRLLACGAVILGGVALTTVRDTRGNPPTL